MTDLQGFDLHVLETFRDIDSVLFPLRNRLVREAEDVSYWPHHTMIYGLELVWQRHKSLLWNTPTSLYPKSVVSLD